MVPDPDVLDTWFSSALWPHSTLGWPEDTRDLQYFYPTTVMETGYDILFFWVARMVMMGFEDTGNIPFHTVYLHGLIRDENGEKMSKVRGNVVNPIDTLEKYGTDALRFSLSTGTAPGNDIKMSPSRLEAGRNFANKLWNAARFVISSIEPATEMKIQPEQLLLEDRWILSRLKQTVTKVNDAMNQYQFGEAQKQIYDFLWGEFCDWYIEIAKIRLRQEKTISPVPILTHVLEVSLRLLHPYMPFVTEELWQHLREYLHSGNKNPDSIMVAKYPETGEEIGDKEAEKTMALVIEIVHAIRNARAEHRVDTGRWISAQIYAGGLTAKIKDYFEVIQNLARVKPVTFSDNRSEKKSNENDLVLLLKEIDIVIPMSSMLDIKLEQERLSKEITGCQAQIKRLEARLNDQNFLNKAPAAVITRERERAVPLSNRLVRLEEELNKLN
jgi:valyl-tRNA synthetase